MKAEKENTYAIHLRFNRKEAEDLMEMIEFPENAGDHKFKEFRKDIWQTLYDQGVEGIL